MEVGAEDGFSLPRQLAVLELSDCLGLSLPTRPLTQTSLLGMLSGSTGRKVKAQVQGPH